MWRVWPAGELVWMALLLAFSTSNQTASEMRNGGNPPRSGVAIQTHSHKFQEVFFPNGTPTLEDPFSETKKKTEYAFYSETDLESLKTVLYSLEIPSQPGLDSSFTVHLALLEGATKSWHVLQDLDLTKFAPVENEFPGNFLGMDGVLNSFSIQSGIKELHVNLWAYLSGSGSISGASDLFYRLKGRELQMVLALKGTSTSRRIGFRVQNIEDSRISIGKIDGEPKIVIQRSRIDRTDGNVHFVTDPPSVYHFKNGKYERAAAMGTAEFKSKSGALVTLTRSKHIRPASIDELDSNNNRHLN